MLFRYALRTPDGADAGEIDLDRPPNVGDTFRSTDHRLRVRAIIPFDLEWFVNKLLGFLEVEPIEVRVSPL
jgi:hypothetical protein